VERAGRSPVVAVGAAVALVVVMTLTPDPPWLYLRIAAVLEPWVAPLVVARVLNVALFVPLGAAIGWWGRPRWLLAALGGSITIELLQFLLDQRSPDALDVATNLLGTLLGYLAARAALRLRTDDRQR
jgi:glycopeptide antibiotics resistance protein